MNLTVMRPTGTKTVEVNWIELDTLKGNLVIQPGHGPAYIVVKPGGMIQWELTTSVVERMVVGEGLLEVQREAALLIIGSD